MPDVLIPIGMTVAAVLVALQTVRKLPELWARPRPTDRVSWFDADEQARAWPVVAVLGSVSLMTIAVAVWLSYGDADAPGWAGKSVTVTVVSLFVVGSAVGWFGRPRFLVPPRLRTREGREAGHEVVINDVRVPPDRADDYEPYFIAICSCGWQSDERATDEEVRSAALEHSSNVRREVERPLG